MELFAQETVEIECPKADKIDLSHRFPDMEPIRWPQRPFLLAVYSYASFWLVIMHDECDRRRRRHDYGAGIDVVRADRGDEDTVYIRVNDRAADR